MVIQEDRACPEPFKYVTENLQLRPLYFVSRTNGLLVPLIAADELPSQVVISGLPSFLTFDQTRGMQHLDTLPPVCRRYSLGSSLTLTQDRAHSVNQHVDRQFHAADKSSEGDTDSIVKRRVAPNPYLDNAGMKSMNRCDPDILKAITNTRSGAAAAASIGYITRTVTSLPPSGRVPDQDKKEYCTYWIRTGECDYTQQGCLYRHEMPDLSVLNKIGFREIPFWWRAKTSALKLGISFKNVQKPATETGLGVKQPRRWARNAQASSDADDSSMESESSSSISPQGIIGSRTSVPQPSTIRDRSAEINSFDELLNDNPRDPLAAPPPSIPNDGCFSSNDRFVACDRQLKTVHVTAPELKRLAISARPAQSSVCVPAGESSTDHFYDLLKRANSQQSKSTNKNHVARDPQLLEKAADVVGCRIRRPTTLIDTE